MALPREISKAGDAGSSDATAMAASKRLSEHSIDGLQAFVANNPRPSGGIVEGDHLPVPKEIAGAANYKETPGIGGWMAYGAGFKQPKAPEQSAAPTAVAANQQPDAARKTGEAAADDKLRKWAAA